MLSSKHEAIQCEACSLLFLGAETVGYLLHKVWPVTHRFVAEFGKPRLEGAIGPLRQSIGLGMVGQCDAPLDAVGLAQLIIDLKHIEYINTTVSLDTMITKLKTTAATQASNQFVKFLIIRSICRVSHELR